VHRLLRRLESFGAFFGAIVLLTHCGGGDLTFPGPPPGPSPNEITIFKGNGQAGPPGAMLRDSIVVKVVDSSGAPLSQQRVDFTTESPGGAVTPQTSTTGPEGLAGARWVLGETAGSQEAVARVVGDGVSDELQVRFTASAEAEVPRALLIRTQPSGSATVGVSFSRQPEIQIRDEKGKDLKSSGIAVTAAVASGDGSLAGTTTRLTDKKGRAEFTDLRVDGATGSYVLIFAANGFTSVTSDAIEVEQPVDQSPVAVNDEYNTTEGHDRTLIVSSVDGVLRNDHDPEGGSISAADASDPPNGDVTLGADGSFTYNPVIDFNGDDQFTYRVSDLAGNSSTAAVTIHVTPVNDAPWFTLNLDPVVGPANGLPQTVSNFIGGISPGAANETDQVLTFEVIGNSSPWLFAAGPTITRDGLGSTATLAFTPAPGQVGYSTITIVLRDNGGTEFGGNDTSVPHSFTIWIQ
jgi:Big-like domain-containing protein